MRKVILFLGNLKGIYFWPLILFFSLKKNHLTLSKKVLLPLIILIFAAILNPQSISYSLAFLIILIYRIINPKIEPNLIIVATFIIIFVISHLIPQEILYSSYLLENKTYRYKGLMTEPAYLGYWSSYFLYKSIESKKWIFSIFFALILFFTSSVGAFIFLILLVSKNIKLYSFISLTLLSIPIIYFNYNQYLNKLDISALSAIDRIENLNITFKYLVQNNFLPMGYGPMSIDNIDIGIMNGLLHLKAFGFFLPFLIIKNKLKTTNKLATFFLLAMVGNFWETPILWLIERK